MEVSRHDDIEPLLDEWAALHAADDRATPYGSPGWARPWVDHYAEGARPWVLAVRDEGRLIGLLALVRRHRHSMRILRPLGEDPADAFDVLALPARREAVESRLAEELRRRSGEWDAIVLTRLRQGVTFGDALNAAGLHAQARDQLPHPHILLPDTFDEFLSRFPSERRTRMRRRLRLLDSGKVTARHPGPDEVPEAIAGLLELRRRQWAATGKTLLPEVAGRRFRDFLTEVAGSHLQAGLATLVEYSCEGERVAVYVDFCDERNFHGFMGGYSPEASRLELGKLHILSTIRQSIEAGRRTQNLGRGGESYKSWFRPEERISWSCAVTSGRVRSRAALLAGTLAGRLR
jgi:CelD/BcsL family acetyltransferase involved in cellulose biosynthesis